MSVQLLVPALTGMFMLGMCWLRTRLHYSRLHAGPLQLTRAGRGFFLLLTAGLVAGWWLAPPLGHALSSNARTSDTLARILWCLAVYYGAVVVHRALRAAGLILFE